MKFPETTTLRVGFDAKRGGMKKKMVSPTILLLLLLLLACVPVYLI
jgi:hypothetical protein